MRNLPSVRSYSYLLTTVPGLQTNNNNVNTGPVFAIFPIHGGRGVESRLTVDGLNISNPPGGNQPPNFTADIGNAQEVTMTTSGGLGEMETAGLTMNIVPKQGGNSISGLVFVSGFSEGMQSDNFTDELQARGATQPTPVYRVYDVNIAVGGPIVKDKLWYYMSVRGQGPRQNTLNVYLQPERRQRERVDLRAGSDQAGVLRSHVGELHAAHHLAGIAAQQVHRSRGTSSRSAASAPARRRSPARRLLCRPRRRRTATASSARSASSRRAGPRRSRTSCSSKPASARPTTSGAARSSTRTRPRDLVQVVNLSQAICRRRRRQHRP